MSDVSRLGSLAPRRHNRAALRPDTGRRLLHQPGVAGAERDGLAPLPAGPSSGATSAADLGTKSGDAAVLEKESGKKVGSC